MLPLVTHLAVVPSLFAGLGIAAVLAAKRVLLRHTLPQATQRAGQDVQAMPPLEAAAVSSHHQSSLEILPLLELRAGGVSSWAPDDAGIPLSSWWEEQEVGGRCCAMHVALDSVPWDCSGFPYGVCRPS